MADKKAKDTSRGPKGKAVDSPSGESERGGIAPLSDVDPQTLSRFATYIPVGMQENIRRAAYWDRLTTGEIVEEALEAWFAKREKKEPLQPIPERKRLRPGRKPTS
jgi:hypothetical protein